MERTGDGSAEGSAESAVLTNGDVAVVVAAGRGLRAGGGVPKQYREVAGRKVLEWTLDALRAAGFARLVVVRAADDAHHGTINADDITWVVGGASRTDSVRAGLQAAAESEREELVRLRAENKQLKMERDVLKKATILFAAEST